MNHEIMFKMNKEWVSSAHIRSIDDFQRFCIAGVMAHEIPCNESVLRIQPVRQEICHIDGYHRDSLLVVECPCIIIELVVYDDLLVMIRLKTGNRIGFKIRIGVPNPSPPVQPSSR